MRIDSLQLGFSSTRAAILAVCTGLFSCASVIGLDDLRRERTADAGPGSGGSTPASPVTGGGATDPTCSGTAGPAGVRVSAGTISFCIDASEVTNDDYAAFLSATPSPPSVPAPDGCDPHASLRPSQGWPYASPDGRHPVTWVDWCDAAAYCAWAGKALCGSGDGSALDPAGDATKGRWYAACAGASGGAYPYGSAYVQGTCNDGAQSGGPVGVATLTRCVGGVDGLFDMSGNVAEWENACATDGDTNACSVRGGAFDTAASSGRLACDGRTVSPRTSGAANVGFRCCSR